MRALPTTLLLRPPQVLAGRLVVEARKHRRPALLIPLAALADAAARHPGVDAFDAFLRALGEPAVVCAVAHRQCLLVPRVDTRRNHRTLGEL